MKPRILYIILLGVIALACSQSTQPSGGGSEYTTDISYDNGDPIMRAAPNGILLPNVHPGTYDAGIMLIRNQNGTNVTGNFSGMAFDSSGYAAEPSSLVMDGVPLEYFRDILAGDVGISIYAFQSSDTTIGAHGDTLSFSYIGFDNENFSAITPVMPPFKGLTFPDTINSSQGLRITYNNPYPGDSIWIAGGTYVTKAVIRGIEPLTVPDNGTISIGPAAFKTNGDSTIYHYDVTLYRTHLDSLTTPMGKKIGICSQLQYEVDIPVKP